MSLFGKKEKELDPIVVDENDELDALMSNVEGIGSEQEEEFEVVEEQTTFNEDSIEELNDGGEVENVYIEN